MSDVIVVPLCMLHRKVLFFLLKCKWGKIWFRSFLLQCKRDEKVVSCLNKNGTKSNVNVV